MPFASRMVADLSTLATTLAAHEGRTLEAVSGKAIGKGGLFKRLAHGADITTGTAEHVLEWFDLNWPSDLLWPVHVARPSKAPAVHVLPPPEKPRRMSVADAVLLGRIAHLPIWVNGRRPAWWHDMEVREFLTRSHRQMSVLRAAEQGAKKFGARCPRKSAIGDYWLRLDQIAAQIAPLEGV